MNKPTLIITGQTGTGKTGIALEIAKRINGQLLSADSRQIFKEMDIGTGKSDVPHSLIYKDDHYWLQGIPIYGINLTEPNKAFSAGEYAEYGKKIIDKINLENGTSIVVGGTGFYIKSLTQPDETIAVPINEQLRSKYAELENSLSVADFVLRLQLDLNKLNPSKVESMNNSDRNNPRRLVRAIEVATYTPQIEQSLHAPEHTGISTQLPWIALRAPREVLEKRIQKRIEAMIHNGLEEEVRKLQSIYSWDSPGLQTMGYREWKGYLEGTQSLEQVKENILQSHLQYARKQIIYLKRFPHIKWIDTSEENWKEAVYNLVISSTKTIQ